MRPMHINTSFTMIKKTSFKALYFLWFALSMAFAQAQSGQTWSLQRCLQQVNEHTDIKQSLLNIEMQRLEVKRLKMQAYPSVSASGNAGFSFDSPLRDDALTHSWNIGAQADIYRGGQLKKERQMAVLQEHIDELSLEQARDALMLKVVNAYLNVMLRKENLIIAREQFSVSSKILDKVKEMVEAGVKAKNELYQAEARVASDKEKLVRAENNKELALLELASALQVPYEGFDIEDIPAEEPAALMYSSSRVIYDYALKTRPEIEAAQKKIELSRQREEWNKSFLRPTLSAGYSLGTNYYYNTQTPLQQDDFFQQLKDNRGQSVSLSLRIPIFDRHNTRYSVQKEKIRGQMAQEGLESEKIRLRTTIDRAYLDAQTAYSTYTAAKVNVKAQKEAYRIAEEKYKLGSMTSYDFEQVRNNLVQSESNLVNAKYLYLLKTKILDYYAGKGL